VVRTHPETGRLALFVNEQFTTSIVGVPREESAEMLETLYAHATQPRFVYRHRWQPHDIVFWDNRSVMHRVNGCSPTERRTLYRTTIEGDVPE
jgi:taurine dioxygenase